MESIARRGQTVYAADGTHMGSVLQCDSRFIVIARSRWTSDHLVVALEEVAASGSDLLILRDLADALRPETAEPWTPAPDPSGNADGVDLEPLRAGMAEIEDRSAGITAARRAPAPAPEPDAHLPTPDDAWELKRVRIARIDAEIDRCIGDELADFEIGAGCAPPTPEAGGARGPSEPVGRAPPPRLQDVLRRAEAAPASPGRPPTATRAATLAARSKRAFERALHRVGFSRLEAKAIAAGGFRTLSALVERFGLEEASSERLPS